MWNKPWRFAEGFAIGGGLVVLGLLLQWVLGPVEWGLLAFPVNLAVAALLLVAIVVTYALRRKVYAFDWMMHIHAAVPAIAWALALTIVMGLTVQTDRGGIPWLSQMLTFWPFVLVYAWMVFIAGLSSLNHIMHFRIKEIPFILNHLGVFIALVSGTLGGADLQQLELTAEKDVPESVAMDEMGFRHDLDFSVELHSFIIEEYPPETSPMRMPKRFASDVSVHTKGGRTVRGTVEVNKPLKVDGWKIYQYDYDDSRPGEVSIFEIVRDSWLPLVYAGIFMMLAGAVCVLFFMAPKPGKKEDGV